MDELLDRYKTRFGEQFPLMLLRDESDKDISRMIQRWLDNEKPYAPVLDPEANY